MSEQELIDKCNSLSEDKKDIEYDDFFKTNQAILVGELNDCRDRMQAVLRGYNENRPH